MKKYFLVAIVMIAVGFSSCAKKEKCWEVSIKGIDAKTYIWGTEDSSLVSAAKKNPLATVTAVSKSEKDCDAVVSAN